MKIINSLVPLAYDLSVSVYENIKTLSEAKRELSANNQMNVNSAADYINNFGYMLEGKKFTRTLNAFSMNYFLGRIAEDYGFDGLSNALEALEQHIEYYENTQKTIMHSTKGIHKKYLTILSQSDPDEREQNDIVSEIQKSSKSKQMVLNELLQLKKPDSEKKQVTTEAYKRQNQAIARIKYLRDFKCQICGISIEKRDGQFYVEAAHIDPKHKEGAETLENIILLCPNHHKEFDLGNREILKRSKEVVEFKLNGRIYQVSLSVII